MIHYATANNFFFIYPYEDLRLWQKATPYYTMEKSVRERYLSGHLRLVYPYNLISKKQLDLLIEKMTLHQWIDSDTRHGHLFELARGCWCWEVQEEFLEEVNAACHEANLLIAYKSI